MTDKNIEKSDPFIEGQSGKDAVKKIGKESPLSLKEAKAVMEAEEGGIEEAIEKTKLEKDKSEKDTEIAPDLVKLKEEQTEKKKEIKQKEKEVKKAVKVEKEVVAPGEPSKFEGKTPEERLEIYKEMESGFTKKSQKVAELEKKVAELDSVSKKIEELEKESVVRQQVQVKLPEYPKDELYYDDPVKYHRKVKEYNDAQLNARLAPLYGSNWTSQKDKIINTLKDNTKDDIVPFKEVEKEVKSRVNRNPAIVNQLGLGASQYFYNQIRNEQLPQKMEDMKTNAKEEVRRELEEENKEMSEEQIMSSDINTQGRESKPIDLEKMLDEGDNPEKVIKAYKKKYKIDFQL